MSRPINIPKVEGDPREPIDTSKPLNQQDYLYLRDRGALPRNYELDTDVSMAGDVERVEPETVVLYDALTVPQLRRELEERGLSADGNKGDLVARLQADDATAQAE